MLTNKPRSFKHSRVIKTGLSDFHRMTVTVMKATFEKLQPRVVNYRDYKYFENCRFRADLLSELSKANIEENEEGLSDFLDTYKRILDLHVPRKQKYSRGNQWLATCTRKPKVPGSSLAATILAKIYETNFSVSVK